MFNSREASAVGGQRVRQRVGGGESREARPDGSFAGCNEAFDI